MQKFNIVMCAPVILLHDDFASRLLNCTLLYDRVVAIDTRGYGDSDKPDGLEHYALENLVEDIPALIKALGENICQVKANKAST